MYLVTGGAGFIGSHLATALLAAGHSVRVVDNLATGRRDNLPRGVEFLEGDLADPAVATAAVQGCEVVLHQAAIPSVPRSIADPRPSHDANINATLNVLLAARDAGVRRVVYAASSSAYGDTAVLPKVEDMPTNPLSPYGLQKQVGEAYCRLFTRLYGLETVSIRYFNVFGPRQQASSPYSGVVSLLIKAALEGIAPTIHGDGLQTRDFTFIDNVVDGVLRAIDAPAAAGEVINVACGQRISLLDVWRELDALLGPLPTPVFTPPRPGDVRDSQADISKAERLLGYRPSVPFAEGLRRTVEWARGIALGDRREGASRPSRLHDVRHDDFVGTVGVIGLGYVGLPLLLAFSTAGRRVIGFDLDPRKPESILRGESYLRHIPGDHVARGVASGLVDATTDFSRVSETDAVIACVPTPLDEHLCPDLSYVTATLEAICPHLHPGHIVSLESTTYPGTTEEELVPRLTALGLVPGQTVFVVYSPERVDPGNPNFTVADIPKVVGGFTDSCLARGVALYSAAFEKVVPVSSCAAAELTKLLENIYRAVNIGLVNELKVVADAMGIDIWEVIRAASTKPFGFNAFYPGPGLGGHCIPIDPFYLTWKARQYGVTTRFIELAGQINRCMPDYVVQRTILALNEVGKAVRGSRVLLLGVAYKADLDDIRESPTLELLDRFEALGAEVSYHDPHVAVIGPTRRHPRWQGLASEPWNRGTVSAADAVVLSTHHRALNLTELAQWATLVIDTRDAMRDVSGNARVVRA